MAQGNMKQEVFDRVAKHLVTQGRQSLSPAVQVGDKPSCAYRGEGGCKCAAGIFIPDSLYTVDMEGTRIIAFIDRLEKEFQSAVNCGELPMELLDELQRCHDNAANWNNGFIGFASLNQLAYQYNLEPYQA